MKTVVIMGSAKGFSRGSWKGHRRGRCRCDDIQPIRLAYAAAHAEQDRALATTPMEELLSLDILQPENIRDMLHAYQLAKCCNVACIFVSVLRDN